MAHGTDRRTVRLEHLYTLAALAAAGAFAALVPTLPNDFWWHLRAGQLIADGGLPTTNRFAWSIPADTPFVYATWLAEWLFYQLYRWLGPEGPALARNGLWLAALGLVALDARRRSGSWRLAGLAALAVAWA